MYAIRQHKIADKFYVATYKNINSSNVKEELFALLVKSDGINGAIYNIINCYK